MLKLLLAYIRLKVRWFQTTATIFHQLRSWSHDVITDVHASHDLTRVLYMRRTGVGLWPTSEWGALEYIYGASLTSRQNRRLSLSNILIFSVKFVLMEATVMSNQGITIEVISTQMSGTWYLPWLKNELWHFCTMWEHTDRHTQSHL